MDFNCFNFGTHLVSTRGPCLYSGLSRLGFGPDWFPTPGLALTLPGPLLDPYSHSRPDSGLGLCQPPSPVQDLWIGPSSRPGLLHCVLCPCLKPMPRPG